MTLQIDEAGKQTQSSEEGKIKPVSFGEKLKCLWIEIKIKNKIKMSNQNESQNLARPYI